VKSIVEWRLQHVCFQRFDLQICSLYIFWSTGTCTWVGLLIYTNIVRNDLYEISKTKLKYQANQSELTQKLQNYRRKNSTNLLRRERNPFLPPGDSMLLHYRFMKLIQHCLPLVCEPYETYEFVILLSLHKWNVLWKCLVSRNNSYILPHFKHYSSNYYKIWKLPLIYTRICLYTPRYVKTTKLSTYVSWAYPCSGWNVRLVTLRLQQLRRLKTVGMSGTSEWYTMLE